MQQFGISSSSSFLVSRARSIRAILFTVAREKIFDFLGRKKGRREGGKEGNVDDESLDENARF